MAANEDTGHERRWPASLTVLVVLVLQLAMPHEVTVGPQWLVLALEAALLVPVVVGNPIRLEQDLAWLRVLSIALAATVALANAVQLFLLINFLTSGSKADPKVLVQGALLIWVTNLAAVALALWELDRGGPFARDPRHHEPPGRPDLLFPQMTGVPGWDSEKWYPGFSDYLFVAFTTATAFSPTDTMPLSPRAKLIMGAGAGVSLLTIAVVAARAVNVL
ncbi:MAG: hypothetical protein ABJA93_06295 [Sporichthyaceae bacterium]